jgi:hypothetical protein
MGFAEVFALALVAALVIGAVLGLGEKRTGILLALVMLAGPVVFIPLTIVRKILEG